MAVPDFLGRLQAGLASLGLKRVIALALAGLFVFTSVAIGSYYLSKPAREVLYTGLDLQDVNQIGAVLGESGISFDVSSEGSTVLVDNGRAAQARMILAEKGLPKSDKAGYELFDNLGSLGLTSFMQQITKVRALEGELARTIQLMKGVKAARVHIVLPQDGSFRSLKEPPSASVVIRADEGDGKAFSPAIQQLVAAAIPGMTRDMVTVLSTDGTVLASAGSSTTAGPEQMVSLERNLAKDIEERVGLTLAPGLGIDNFRISVSAKLNTDRRETNETIYDPESRVERSVRSVKEQGEAQNKNAQGAVGVDQNIPTETTASSGGSDQSSEKNDKREELTNYEINSKLVATKSEGYNIENLSVAIVVNKTQLAKLLGGSPTPEQITAQMSEFEALAASAAGINAKRGDQIKVTAIDFMPADAAMTPLPGEGVMSIVTNNLGNMINAGALITVVLLVIFLGLKPALRQIMAHTPPAAPELPMLGGMDAGGAAMGGFPSALPMGMEGGMSDNLVMAFPSTAATGSPVQQRLEALVSRDTDKAAKVLKQWLANPNNKASAV
jgi:flagellar M-ring protein FliF